MEKDYEYVPFPPEKWEQPPDYFLDNYGRCALHFCICIRSQWLGRACPHWRPLGATDHKTMMEGTTRRD